MAQVRHMFSSLKSDTYCQEAEQRAPHYVEAWLERYPESKPAVRDFEDWAENATYLVAAKDLGIDLVDAERPSGAFVSASRRSIMESQEGPPGFFYTGISDAVAIQEIKPPTRLLLQRHADLEASMEYYRTPEFVELAGRDLHPAFAEPSEINRIVRDMIPGEGEFFMKTIDKQFAGKVQIEAGVEPWDAICQRFEGIEWDPITKEGDRLPAYLIQPAFEPSFEYRLFMVDGKVATSAGCVELFTPIDNEKPFDAKMERIRNGGELLMADKLVEQFVERANQFGADWKDKGTSPRVYGLDLCVDAKTNEIRGIEINPAMNLGRYASDTHAYMRSVDTMLHKVLEQEQAREASLARAARERDQIGI